MSAEQEIFETIREELRPIALTLEFKLLILNDMKHAILQEHEKVKMLDPKNFPVVFTMLEATLEKINKIILLLDQATEEIKQCETKIV